MDMDTLSSRAYRLHVEDQVLAMLRDRGPMTTVELCEALPRWEWENAHYKWSTRVSPDWLRQDVLYRLHRQGKVERTAKWSAYVVMWWIPSS